MRFYEVIIRSEENNTGEITVTASGVKLTTIKT